MGSSEEFAVCCRWGLNGVFAVDAVDVVAMPVGVVGVGGLVGPEFAFLVEVAPVLGVDYLVASGLGIDGDGPFALLWLCIVYLICPNGIVACA